jgi:hypothetical protein
MILSTNKLVSAKIRSAIGICLLTLASAEAVEAQSLQALQVGDRIRIQIEPSHSWRIGRYDGLGRDTLWMSQCDDCLGGVVPLARINELDAVAFGAIGSVLGAAVGAILPTPQERWRKILPP